MRPLDITMSHRVVETISFSGRVISGVTSWNERARRDSAKIGGDGVVDSALPHRGGTASEGVTPEIAGGESKSRL
jgi:hypothetical protein